ncbi:MAG: transcription-repair coupling factor [Bacteroidales bacterium]|nr:transcription-repair coupling factor [Bacteroidales bacterium]
MALEELIGKAEKYPQCNSLTEQLKSSDKRFHLKGLSGSAKSLFSAAIIRNTRKHHLFILPDKESAAYYYTDLLNLLGDANICFFPSSYKRSVRYQQIDNASIILRHEVMNAIGELKKNTDQSNGNLVIVTYPEALVEKVVTHQKLLKNTLKLVKGEKIGIEFIEEVLHEYRFQRTDFVYEPGQYAIRGGIVDIYSFASKEPFRIDFFGDEVDSIRSFNIETQLSEQHFDQISILPDVQKFSINDVKESFLDFIPSDTLVWITDTRFVSDTLGEIYENTDKQRITEDNITWEKELNLITGHYFIECLNRFKTIESGARPFYTPDKEFVFNSFLQPAFNKNFNLLANNMIEFQKEGYSCYILSESEKQIDRLKSIFHEINSEIQFIPCTRTLHDGFADHELKICCYTDHQIFERYHKYRLNTEFINKAALTLKELTSLHPGDYVVHIDHGIGRFGGLEKIEVNGKMQEAIRLIYQDKDTLYVSIHSLHRISKYKGKDEAPPKIYKLGSGAWQKLKQATKKKIKDIAKDLIALYAKRKTLDGFRYSPDSYLQNELEASFIYEDTPDQLTATNAVKQDMESASPMDRLVCGDVGFGKTEIAVRAAFKAAADNKQVAILVPTTILALQHFNTFKDRLKDFPCNIDYISRFKAAKEQKQILTRLREGKTDIIIGTHKLLGKEVQFKDLGLLIIDEEQKFGVAAKEKLRAMRENIDTLTLTATPIPRTLQFSLMGSRDLSIINTPPPNRYPIATELHVFNEDIIAEGIEFEVNRGGQVFFIHNRVQNIEEIERLINRLCPKIKTLVAHGQMEGSRLERIMLDFINGDYDVLVSTAIIESGLDIPNANTIFINNAHHFGLSDLHQLRGRVGRSNKKAVCYLLAPPLSLLTPEARRRLKAIEEFSGLGSGMNIALQDLDIRGAGNLLGAEQSGFIADIGFEVYNRILNEAIRELRETEYPGLFDTAEQVVNGQKIPEKYVEECQVDTDLELLFPDEYISNVSERLNLYRELDNVETEEKLTEFQTHLEDRFGKLPGASIELLSVVRLRWLARSLGIEKIVLRKGIMINYFVSNQQALFYKSTTFANILNYVQKQPVLFKLKESNNKLQLSVDKIRSVYDAIGILTKLADVI